MDGPIQQPSVVVKYFYFFILFIILLLTYSSIILNQYVNNWFILGIILSIAFYFLTIHLYREFIIFTFCFIYSLYSVVTYSYADSINVTIIVLSAILIINEFLNYGNNKGKHKTVFDALMGISLGGLFFIIYMYIIDLGNVNIDPNLTSTDDKTIIEEDIQYGNQTHRCALYQNNEFVRYI